MSPEVDTRTPVEKDIEKLLDTMARLLVPGEGISAGELARRLNWEHRIVRARLRDLEVHGQVYRTGERDETRWYLG